MKYSHVKSFYLSALFVGLSALTTASAQITPSADAYTNSADLSTNYGTAVTLGVVNSATSIQTTYIQFDLSSIPAGYTSANIAKATLKLYVNAVTTAGSFNVDYVNGAWTEKTIKASLAPALGSTIVSSVPLTSSNVHDYVLIDVTSAVGAWLNGTQTNDGIALVANSPLSATFDSKENTSQSHPAELDVVFNGAITGVTTASGSGLTGGGTSGTLNLGLITSCSSGQILAWNGSAWACKTVSGTGTVTSVASGVGLTGGPITTKGTLSVDTTAVPFLAAANTFTNGQTIKVSSNADGLDISTSGGTGVSSTASSGVGVAGTDSGTTDSGSGVLGISLSPSGYGLWGLNTAGGTAVYGTSSGFAVHGLASGSGFGVVGEGAIGVVGSNSAGGTGVDGSSTTGTGVQGIGQTGVWGASYACCSGTGGTFYGYTAPSGSGNSGTDGIDAVGGYGDQVYEYSFGGVGVRGTGGTGLFVDGPGGVFQGGTFSVSGDGVDAYAGSGYAGVFYGNVSVTGAISAGTKDFKIDHPLDPANKYLVHASVESSEMMNIYTGNVTTDAAGDATVLLPDWFEVLNTDFRYQLTVIGQFAQAVVAREIQDHQFLIKTNVPNVKVSWQVTGVRQDAFAKAHPLVVEEEKGARLKGFYLHPDLYGAPEEKQIEWVRHPEMMKRMKEQRQAPPPALRSLPPGISQRPSPQLTQASR